MSQPSDDKMLDEYLAGDSPFSRRYRETPAHEVPPELDAKILAASKAPARRSALSRWRVWSAPVALAATLVITVAVILRGGIEQAAVKAPDLQKPVEVTTRQEIVAPAAPPAAAAPEQQPQVVAHEELDSRAKDKASAAPSVSVTARKIERPDLQEIGTSVTTKPLPTIEPSPLDRFANAPAVTVTSNASQKPQATAPEARRSEPIVVTAHKRTASDDASSLQETIVTGTVRRAQPASGAGPHNSIQPAEKSERTLAKEAREADPRGWLEYIRDLRKNNDIRAADREWKAFVKAYPGYPVPEDDDARPR